MSWIGQVSVRCFWGAGHLEFHSRTSSPVDEEQINGRCFCAKGAVRRGGLPLLAVFSLLFGMRVSLKIFGGGPTMASDGRIAAET